MNQTLVYTLIAVMVILMMTALYIFLGMQSATIVTEDSSVEPIAEEQLPMRELLENTPPMTEEQRLEMLGQLSNPNTETADVDPESDASAPEIAAQSNTQMTDDSRQNLLDRLSNTN